MREGRLLAEESPSRLLTIFNTETLEEVFLILSRRQEEGRLDNLNAHPITDEQNNSMIDTERCTGSTVTVVSEVSNERQASTDVSLHIVNM